MKILAKHIKTIVEENLAEVDPTILRRAKNLKKLGFRVYISSIYTIRHINSISFLNDIQLREDRAGYDFRFLKKWFIEDLQQEQEYRKTKKLNPTIILHNCDKFFYNYNVDADKEFIKSLNNCKYVKEIV